MNKKMFMIESLKLDKTLFDINGPLGIISSIFNIYTDASIENDSIHNSSYLEEIFRIYDTFIKEDIAVIYITADTINKDYKTIIKNLNDDVISYHVLDNDTITIKVKNYHLHKKNLISFQKPKYMMTIYTLYHKYIYSNKTQIKSILINDLTDIYILSEILNITLNETLTSLVMHKIKLMDKDIYQKILKHYDSKFVQSLTPRVYDQLFEHHRNQNHSLLNKIAKSFVDVFNSEDYLSRINYPFHVDSKFYEKRQLMVCSFEETFLLIQSKDKSKLMSFLKTLFENDYQSDIINKTTYFEIVISAYEIAKSHCYYFDKDITMVPIQSFSYGIHDHMIYERRRGKKISVIEYLEYYEEHQAKHIKDAFIYWFNFLAKEGKLKLKDEFYDSILYSSILNQVIKRYFHERHHAHLYISFEAEFMGYIDELFEVGENKLHRYYHLSYDLFRMIRKGDSIEK
jgi:hypothetical protein